MYAQKSKLAARSNGYRTSAGYKKVNQSTSNIQMSSALSNFSGTHGLNQKRMRKANAVQYEKNVLDARKHSQERENAKYDPGQWKNFSNEHLWDKLVGAQNDPNHHTKGISGYKYEASAVHRQKKLGDMRSSIPF